MYLLQALRTEYRICCPQPESAVDEVVELCLHHLSTFPERVVLLLDDFHLISNPARVQIRHQPDAGTSPSDCDNWHCNSVLTAAAAFKTASAWPDSRAAYHEPALRDSRVAQLMQHELMTALSKRSVARLEDQRRSGDGLVADRALAGHRRRDLTIDDVSLNQVLNQFSTTCRHIFDHSAEEVFDQQTAAIQRFLLRTSVLHRLNRIGATRYRGPVWPRCNLDQSRAAACCCPALQQRT